MFDIKRARFASGWDIVASIRAGAERSCWSARISSPALRPNTGIPPPPCLQGSAALKERGEVEKARGRAYWMKLAGKLKKQGRKTNPPSPMVVAACEEVRRLIAQLYRRPESAGESLIQSPAYVQPFGSQRCSKRVKHGLQQQQQARAGVPPLTAAAGECVSLRRSTWAVTVTTAESKYGNKINIGQFEFITTASVYAVPGGRRAAAGTRVPSVESTSEMGLDPNDVPALSSTTAGNNTVVGGGNRDMATYQHRR